MWSVSLAGTSTGAGVVELVMVLILLLAAIAAVRTFIPPLGPECKSTLSSRKRPNKVATAWQSALADVP
jgi:hypothetical protein